MILRPVLFVLGVGLVCLSFLASAQQPTKVPTVALLVTNAPVNDPLFDPL